MMQKFNVFIWNFNDKQPQSYDVIPYFQQEWADEKYKNRFKTFEDIKRFIDSKARYQFWARCEYEFIIKSWPNGDKEVKVDIYDQIKMNLDLVTTVFIKNIGLELK